MSRITFACLAVFLSACNGDPEETDTDAPATADTDTDTPQPNDWGSLCSTAQPGCPTDQECAFPPLPDGSITEGYCSPVCQVDADCTEGYFGPGSASCVPAPTCLISCSTAYADGACPEGLTCLPTGGPTNACGVPR